jgi:hypothetical protein
MDIFLFKKTILIWILMTTGSGLWWLTVRLLTLQHSNYSETAKQLLWEYVCLRQNQGIKSSPVTGLEWPRGLQEVKVPRFHDNSTGWW